MYICMSLYKQAEAYTYGYKFMLLYIFNKRSSNSNKKNYVITFTS